LGHSRSLGRLRAAKLIAQRRLTPSNTHRPRRALPQSPPAGHPPPPAEVTGMRVLRRDRPGGLIREYAQVAWGDIVSAPTDYCPSIPLAGAGSQA